MLRKPFIPIILVLIITQFYLASCERSKKTPNEQTPKENIEHSEKRSALQPSSKQTPKLSITDTKKQAVIRALDELKQGRLDDKVAAIILAQDRTNAKGLYKMQSELSAFWDGYIEYLDTIEISDCPPDFRIAFIRCKNSLKEHRKTVVRAVEFFKLLKDHKENPPADAWDNTKAKEKIKTALEQFKVTEEEYKTTQDKYEADFIKLATVAIQYLE